ncbi:FlaA1/EpsC-like NDP-sugar epimerase [Oribacterium sinus]|uniref:FlaA1/EpsC-like NDP-sugar epimerase n=1 Tax=Oribacterium sinus TaxID=237576 RepID=A0A7W9SHY6_9FIRM|nr:FlaA1/EpsC-like NDP-sugar epimerase [Oribacterium sinus]
MKIYLRLISLWLCFGSLYLLMRRLLFTDAQDMRMIFSVVIYSWLYVFFAMITSGTSKKKFNIFLYLLLVVFLSMSVEHLFMSYTPNTWKDNTMAFFGDIFCFILIWVSSILASKLMIRGYRRLKNVAIV